MLCVIYANESLFVLICLMCVNWSSGTYGRERDSQRLCGLGGGGCGEDGDGGRDGAMRVVREQQ